MDKNIQYILEVSRQAGITKAANKLYITPSALSRFVQARESELNVLLFHRIGKRFVPTEAGKYYIQKCQEIEQLQLELNQQMQHFANISNKVIQIGVQPSFSTVVLDKVLPAFRKIYPDMKIVLQEYSAANLMEMLRRQEVDVILATTDKRDSDYEYQLVKSCETVVAVEKNHPLITQAVSRAGFRYPWIELVKCAMEENVMLLPDSKFRQKADELYACNQLIPNIGYQISGTRTGLACVACNQAVMITLDHMIFNSLFSDRIVPLSVGEKPSHTELNLVFMKDTVFQKEIQKLYKIICKQVR